MTEQTTNIDRLMSRHLELAIRLFDTGYGALALEVTLAALRHEPPARDSPLVQFLMQAILPSALRKDDPRGDEIRRFMADREPIQEEVAWWGGFCADEEAGLPQGEYEALTAARTRLRQERNELEERPLSERFPSGCVQGVIVEPSGKAKLVRVFVRFVRSSGFAPEQVDDQIVPGKEAAIAEARHYLSRAGCESVDGYQVELLIEGLFRPVEGESLALAVFLAAVSFAVGMAVPNEWAFTGAVGSASADAPGGTVMPVNELQAKLAACAKAGCTRLVVPAHLVSGLDREVLNGACSLEPVLSTTQAVDAVLSAHRLPETPRLAGWRESLRGYMGEFLPFAASRARPSADLPHRSYRIVVPVFFALMLTERWLIGDYLIPEYYQGVYRASGWLAVVLGVFAGAVLAGVLLASLRVVDRLMGRGAIAPWWILATYLLAGHVLAWLVVQLLIRDPFAAPPRGIYFEHRTLQWWKDTLAIFFYALIFFVSPYARVRLAERAAATGRLRWAREILEGRRWAGATFPIATLPLLVVIASIGIMGLGYLDWQSLSDPSRAGADPTLNGWWRTVHIIGKGYLYLASCVLGLWWLARATSRVSKAAGAELAPFRGEQ